LPAFPLSLVVLLLEFFAIAPFSNAGGVMRTDPNKPTRNPMPTIRRSALVEHSAARMFALVNDIPAYPRRFDWCDSAQVLEADDDHLVARLDLGLGALRTWFTTHNSLKAPHHIDMKLVGPALAVGFQSLADRMVDDFVRVADSPEEAGGNAST